MILPQLPQDKANHILYGFVVATIVSLFSSRLIGFAVAALAGAGKEAMDYIDRRRAGASTPIDLFDFLATVAGGAAFYASGMLP
jgi:hypothetical protein